ncbi:hypothetical protein [Verrucomicrobium spinosum]|uniref:hypothetical protein n=1 Tax=Verrucomicrobium spinosum TaxID=2736 RepID=UPI0009463902|nr:hypothetical protein [Verrucomicrobium spinosum]
MVITLDGQVGNWKEMENRVDKRRDENAERREREQREERRKEREKKREREQAAKKDAPAQPADKNGEDQRKHEELQERMAWLLKSRSLKAVLGLTVERQNFVMTAKGAIELEKSPQLPLKDGELRRGTAGRPSSSRKSPRKSPRWMTRRRIRWKTRRKLRARTRRKTKSRCPPPTAGRPLPQPMSIMIAEQRIGQGSVVVATDSYFASNEALLKERAPQFLAWLVGPSREVIFDEFHLGTVESPGIMTLARRLHLQGLFIGGLVLFGLFIWQSSSSLVPAEDVAGKESEAVVSGHGATAGLISLLRRGISRGQLLTRCFEVWEKSARQNGAAASRVAAAEKVMAPVKGIKLPVRQVAGVYRQICEAVHTGPVASRVVRKFQRPAPPVSTYPAAWAERVPIRS